MKFVCCLLLILSVTAFSQSQSPAWQVYLNWQKDVLAKQEKGLSTPHYCLAAITQRLNSTSTQIDFLAAGKMRGFTLEIQPIQITKLADGKIEQKNAGELTQTSIKGTAEELTTPATLQVIVPITTGANGFEVKWKVNNESGTTIHSVFQVSESQPTENIVTLISQ